MELLDFGKKENPVTWTFALTIARSYHEEGSTGSACKIGATASPITSETNSFSYIVL